MADCRRRRSVITKDAKLTIIVEECINDVLVVRLEHGSKIFRGVLLDATKRNLPPGICASFGGAGEGGEDVATGNRQTDASANGSDGECDMSATVYRHTYNQNVSQFGTQFQGPPNRNFTRTASAKTTRNIRLRPRQTLCSKCKSSCLDSDKGPIPVNPGTRFQNNQSTIRTRQNDVLRNSKPPAARIDLKKRQNEISVESEPQPTKLIKLERPCMKLTKTSPFIKISIGESTVMNIPPRIHEDKESDRDASSEEKADGTDDDHGGNITNIESHLDEETYDKDEEKDELPIVVYKKHKKSLKKTKEKDKLTVEEECEESTSHHKKHKKKHKHKVHTTEIEEGDTKIIITENTDHEESSDEKNENSEPNQMELIKQRPRLLYTWRENKGLSPRRETRSNSQEEGYHPKPFSPQRDNSNNAEPNHDVHVTSIIHKEPNVKSPDHPSNGATRKEYKLRSRSKSLDSNPGYELTSDSAYVSYEDPKSISDRSEGCSTENETSGTSGSEYGDGPPGDENIDSFRPLMMKIQTNSVSKCVTTDGRKINIGDIIWGKIQGFPWWPGRVLSVAVSQRDNGVVIRQIAHVAWFGSSTMSHIQCSDLYPFLEDFKLRYNRKKRGPYKSAIKQATIAAQSGSSHHNIDFNDYDL